MASIRWMFIHHFGCATVTASTGGPGKKFGLIKGARVSSGGPISALIWGNRARERWKSREEEKQGRGKAGKRKSREEEKQGRGKAGKKEEKQGRKRKSREEEKQGKEKTKETKKRRKVKKN